MHWWFLAVCVVEVEMSDVRSVDIRLIFFVLLVYRSLFVEVEMPDVFSVDLRLLVVVLLVLAVFLLRLRCPMYVLSISV